VRKSVAGIVVGVGAAALVLGIELASNAVAGGKGVTPFQTVELKTYDFRFRRTARPKTARQDIALIEIDEYSLRNLEPYLGKWPWPRLAHAELVEYLSRAPAKVIAYDVNFAEADTRTGFDYGGSQATGRQSDQAWADAIKAAGNVILLADATYEAAAGAAIATSLSDAGYRIGGAIRERRAIFPPFPAIRDVAAAFGHNLFSLDPDGPIRHMTPFVRSGDVALPSLGVAAALRTLDIKPAGVRLDGTTLHIGDRAMPVSVVAVPTTDRVDTFVWSLINFRGPAQLPALDGHTYPTYSFFDLLSSEEQLRANQTPNIDPSLFRDKIVFVGATAAGLYDAFETPFANGRSPGIYIHAAVADDILSNRFMHPESTPVTVAAVLVIGLAVGAIATVIPAWWATAATGVILGAFAFGATEAFAAGYWLNLSQPTLAGAFALFGGVGYQYFVEGREKRKMKRLFGQYVSKDVYDQLVNNPALARLGGHRRQMTVLFSDIRGFTSVSEKGEPEEIVQTLNEYFTRMVDIVFTHKGTLDKFVGDMVMALFGAPLDDVNHAEHAVDAALDMIDELLRLNERWTAEGRPSLDIGIGINTGPMIAGNIGSEAIMSYTVLGDAVNLGSRLESLNKNYGTRIIISDATRAALPDRYIFRPLGDVVVKGKTRAVAIFEVVGRAAQAADPGNATVTPAAKEAQL
jgi:adenylate cyclase